MMELMANAWSIIVQKFCEELPNEHDFHAKDICKRIVHPADPEPMQWENTEQLVEYLYDYLASVRVRMMFHMAWNFIPNMQNIIIFERREARLVRQLISCLEPQYQFSSKTNG